MATKILDLDFKNLPETIPGLSGYSQALILLRIGDLPVGQLRVALQGDHLERPAILQALAQDVDWPFWDGWLNDYLGITPEKSVATPLPASIAICTRDRPDDLGRALESLQRLPDDGQEILVVDSFSAGDATRRVVENFAGVRYLREDRPGLNRARNRALREARHEIVAFIDDDAAADPGWLRGLIKNFASPSVMCVTGLTMPRELETEAQEWFERYSPFCRGFRRKVFDQWRLSPLSAHRAGAGANMSLRKEVLNHVGGFDEALDAGTPTRSGGDTEMFARILTRGYQIVYDPAALNWHRHRRTWEELRAALFGYGVGAYSVFTQRLVTEKDLAVFWPAFLWLVSDQIPGLLAALFRRPDSLPLDLRLAEMRGCLAGPGAYLSSRRIARGRSE